MSQKLPENNVKNTLEKHYCLVLACKNEATQAYYYNILRDVLPDYVLLMSSRPGEFNVKN